MKYLATVILVLMLFGCSTGNIQSSAKTLKLTQQSVVIAAKTADSLCAVGTLDAAACRKCAELYDQAKDAYFLAIEAELLFIDATIAGESTEGFAEYKETAILKFLQIANEMNEVIGEY